ncbi:SH3 domain-containing protein [Pararhodospirillum photometricum]|nr:SH3 domain-containing protein [Pararhodospirillum photometricum]
MHPARSLLPALLVTVATSWLLSTVGETREAPAVGVQGKAPAAPTAPAQALDGEVTPREAPSGLPLPRFVSLRSDAVNMRSGPGTRYPVVWIYRLRDLPVEVIAEYDNWRKIRDQEGTEGWVHQNMLAGRRFLVTLEGIQVLRTDPAPHARPLARVGPGVIGRLLACPRSTPFCRVEVAGHLGWLPRAGMWGVYREEVLD